MGDSIDFIWIDNEHTPMSYESLAGHILAAHLHGVAVIVRVQAPNFNGAAGAPWGWSIKAALDSGADGIIVPQVRTVDEVRSIVSDCRYPTGPNREPPFDKKQTGPSTALDYRKRGMGHMIPSNYHREEFYHYTAEADKNIYVIMQVRSGGFVVGWGGRGRAAQQAQGGCVDRGVRVGRRCPWCVGAGWEVNR